MRDIIPTANKPGLWHRFRVSLRKYWFIYLLTIPGLISLILFNYKPMYGVLLAFKSFNMRLGIWKSPWVGLQNFQNMFADPVFIQAFRNTVIINLYNIIFGFAFNIFLALMINEMKFRRVKSVVQTFVYLPYFLSWVIFSGIVMVFLSSPAGADPGGLINQLIASFGGTPVDFLKRPELFRGILVITNIIKTAGYSTIIYLAAIAGVSPSLYESAAIDGANRRHMLLYITLPRILPSITVMFILSLAGLFVANFDQVYNLYSNFVLSTGDVISTYTYRISLGSTGAIGGKFEVATAMNFLLNTMGLVVVLAANRFVKKLDVMGIF